MDAIVLRNVSKDFKKSTIRREHTTFKSELVRMLLRRSKKKDPRSTIQALHDVNLTVKRGETFGLLGRNGSGKSTLLKLVSGIYTATAGTLEVNGRISALLELGAGFHPEFSGRENIVINGIILGMSRKEIRARADEIIEFSELGDFIDEPVRTYSSGMFMRLAFSIATHVDPDVLIIDEILAVGDQHFRTKSQAKMNEFRKRGKTILLVTHDLDTVQQWCDSAAWLDQGRLRRVGDPAEVVRAYLEAVAQGAPEATAPARDGLSAPEVVQPRSGPPAMPGRRWGSFAAEIEEVRLDRPRPTFDPEEPLECVIRFRAFEALHDAEVRVELARADGLVLWSGSSPVVPVLPSAGEVALSIARLGLAEGSYHLNVSLHAGTSCCDAQHRMHFFEVGGGVTDGLVSLPHRWAMPSLDAAVAPAPEPRLNEGVG